jgi:hypothetical protein
MRTRLPASGREAEEAACGMSVVVTICILARGVGRFYQPGWIGEPRREGCDLSRPEGV